MHAAGDNAVLIELGEVSVDQLHAAAAAARRLLRGGVCVAGHSSLLVVCESAGELERFITDFDATSAKQLSNVQNESRSIEVRVSFEGDDAPDLDELLAHAGITRSEFVRAITQAPFRARFLGFRPGFAYLEGLPPRLHMPRRPTSRERVPAGSFAIAADMAAFYPTASPGGWHLVGRTDALLWDERREPPNLISAGDHVRIVPVASVAERPEPAPQVVGQPVGQPVATVTRAGQLTLIVGSRDLRRYDYGLPPGGPFDPRAAAAANLAAGNTPDAALLECSFVGPTLEFARDSLVSVGGATAEVWLNGATVPRPTQIAIRSGDTLRIGVITGGARAYVAVAGGIERAASPFTLAPTRVTEGTILIAAAGRRDAPRLRAVANHERLLLTVKRGPHLENETLAQELIDAEWLVTRSADRTGVRVQSKATSTGGSASMRSCGIQFGSVQLHPNGDLLIMGPDHPVTGGYPQPFTIVSNDLWKIAQLRPHETLRWRATQ